MYDTHLDIDLDEAMEATMLESCDDISLYLEYCKCQIEEHGDKTEKTENLEALLLVLVHAQSTFGLQILRVL